MVPVIAFVRPSSLGPSWLSHLSKESHQRDFIPKVTRLSWNVFKRKVFQEMILNWRFLWNYGLCTFFPRRYDTTCFPRKWTIVFTGRTRDKNENDDVIKTMPFESRLSSPGWTGGQCSMELYGSVVWVPPQIPQGEFGGRSSLNTTRSKRIL